MGPERKRPSFETPRKRGSSEFVNLLIFAFFA
jgi:hypothetical protein